MKVIRTSLLLILVILSVLLFVLNGHQSFDYILAQTRSYENDLYATSPPWFDVGIYSYLIQGESGAIFSVSQDHILKIEPDGTMRFFHLTKFAPCVCTIAEGKIHIYSNYTVYRYDENGKYLDHDSINDPSKLPMSTRFKPVESDEKIYSFYRGENAYVTGVQMTEADRNATNKIIFRSFAPRIWNIIVKVISVLRLCIAILFLICVLHRKQQEPGRFLRKKKSQMKGI